MSSTPSFQPTDDDERDRTTVALLLAGNEEGLDRLLEDHGSLVKARLRRTFGTLLDDLELDEVMNLTGMRVWNAAKRFDPERGTLRAWLSVIARNCALRWLEARRRTAVQTEGNLDRLPFVPRDDRDMEQKRQRMLVDMHRCIQQLPALQRAVLLADLDAGDSVPAQQLALHHGTSTSSIYVSRLKGRRALRAALAALGHTFPGLPTPPRTQRPESRAEQG